MNSSYQFIDKAKVDPVLDMRWSEFLSKYPNATWPGGESETVEGFIEFTSATPLDQNRIEWILKNKTIRWTLYRAGLGYHFLDWIIGNVPKAKRACAYVEPECFDEAIAILSMAIDGYLKGKIGKKAASSALMLVSYNPGDLIVTKKELQIVLRLHPKKLPGPNFGSLSAESVGDDYTWLTPGGTKRFMGFLRKALDENWCIERFPKENEENLRAAMWREVKTLRARNLTLAKNLLRVWEKRKFEKPFLTQYLDL